MPQPGVPGGFVQPGAGVPQPAMPAARPGMPMGSVPGGPGAPMPPMPGGAMPGAPMPGGFPQGVAPGTKMCPNGHVMQAGWANCPYCPRAAGPRKEIPKTRVADAVDLSKAAAAPVAPKPKPKAPAKTKLIEFEEAAPAAGWLVGLNGKYKGKDFKIKEGKNTVGGDKTCDIVLEDDFISKRHANINHIRKDGENIFILVDLDSANGTFLNDNDQPINKEELVDNDKVCFGKLEFRFKCI